jgi:hypothetical protein
MKTADRRNHARLLVAGIVLAALSVAFFMPVPNAGAATLTACVKKGSGAMRLVTGKKAKRKCPRGWRKVTWNVRGPAGPQLRVRASNGALVGKFRGVFPSGGAIYVVERAGGLYIYFGSGSLYPTGSPSFINPDCSGSAYLTSSSGLASTLMLLKMVGGTFRYVFRTSSGGTLGPSKAWKSAGTFQSVVAVPTYRLNGTTGLCELDSPGFNGDLIAMQPVAAPPDFIGPLAIR